MPQTVATQRIKAGNPEQPIAAHPPYWRKGLNSITLDLGAAPFGETIVARYLAMRLLSWSDVIGWALKHNARWNPHETMTSKAPRRRE